MDEPVDEPNDQADDRRRIEAASGKRSASLVAAPGHGAPSNRRWLVAFDDGSAAFAKIAAFDYTADWLRLERTNYGVLAGHDYLPRLLGWHDDGEAPALVIEDLASAHWPPPWTTARIDAVLEALSAVQATPPPEQIQTLFGEMFDIQEGWLPLRADPARALALGLFDDAWLAAWGETLTQAAGEALLEGNALLHGDVRSDNLCLVGERAVFVDWNWACVGSPLLDVAAWLPSLHHEGGPAPWEILPGEGALASLLAGFFLEHAGDPPIPQAPHVRQLQLDQGRVALAWACRELGIAPPR
ncbi:MAG: aminoglycoside phosphotransferase family protein [Actinomycetota bacterium]